MFTTKGLIVLYGIQRTCAVLVLVLLTLGWNTGVWALDITYGQTIEGSLDATDPTFPDGSHYDEYTFTAEAGRPYMITIKSDTFATWGVLQLLDVEAVPLQAAYVFQPGVQVQFSGTLEQSGQYRILVSTSPAEEDPAVLGSYTLTLSEPNNVSSDCIGGTRESPVMISDGQTLQCMMTDQDVPFTDEQNNTYFGKFFTYQSNGQPFTITAQSAAFPFFLRVYDPVTGDPIISEASGTVTVDQLPPGPVLFAVVAFQPETVGEFTVTLSSSSPMPSDCDIIEQEPNDRSTPQPVDMSNCGSITITGRINGDFGELDSFMLSFPGPAHLHLSAELPAGFVRGRFFLNVWNPNSGALLADCSQRLLDCDTRDFGLTPVNSPVLITALASAQSDEYRITITLTPQ